MFQTWRWFGNTDRTPLTHVRQAGAEGIVTALHHLVSGDVWSPAEIEKRQNEVRSFADGSPSGLDWVVVESLVVSEAIKQQAGDYRTHFANYRQSLENLAAAGIHTVCYNFMPVIDWTRTHLAWPLAHGGTAMRFDLVDFAVFDIYLLARPGAEKAFTDDMVAQAATRFAAMSGDRKTGLVANIVAGLPGSNEKLTLDQVREHLALYDDISRDRLARNFIDFLGEIIPTAERLGVRMCCHPDDPPFELLGMPRVMSTHAHIDHVLGAVDSQSNGLTFCSGSLSSRPDNDLLAMIDRFGPKIHFAHLRSVKRDGPAIAGSFFEDEHLAGDTGMVEVVRALMGEEARRRAEGRPDWQIPMRPDHGQDIIDDLGRSGQPGYPTIGRLKGLAELRGVMAAVEAGAPPATKAATMTAAP